MCIVTHSKEQNYRFYGSKTPSLRVNRNINSFVHSSSSNFPYWNFSFYYYPSLFLLALPILVLFTLALIVFIGMPLEG